MSDIRGPENSCEAIEEALGSRYEILSNLGEGSFGTVYKANDRSLNRIVAIKSVRLEDSSDPLIREDLSKRFLREAQVAAQLNHPHIVTIHDIISTPRASLIVMEFVEGVSLRSVLASRKRLDLPETLAILSQVAEALDYAHERKVVHRDVKPANIMIKKSNDVRVTDFGIAKTDTPSDLTLAGTILGTPDYMSPEQAMGDPVDGRSDLFSFGCVLHECLTGEKPFKGETVTAVLLRIVSDDPAPAFEWASLDLPSELGAVMRRALAKDASERYDSGAALIRDLRAQLSKGQNGVGKSGAAQVGSHAPHIETTTAFEAEEHSPDHSTKQEPADTSLVSELQKEERILCFSTEDSSSLQSLDLSPGEAFVVSRIDGLSRPREILAVSPLSEKETARTLLGLIEAGIIRFQGRSFKSPCEKEAAPEKRPSTRVRHPSADSSAEALAKAESYTGPAEAGVNSDPSTDAIVREINRLYDLARFQNHTQLLGIPRNAGLEEIKRAFQEKSARYNSNNYPNISDPDFHNKLRYLLKSTYESFAALSKRAGSNPGRKPDSNRSAKQATGEDLSSLRADEPLSGEEIYVGAKKAYENQDYWTAIELCRNAIELCDKEAKYHHLLGLALLENPNWRKEAEESLRKATELDPNNGEYFEVLGTLYEQEGLPSRAKKMFEKAKSNSN